MNDYEDDDFFESDDDFSDDDEMTELGDLRRRKKGFNWRKIEAAKERLALRRELGDFDFGIE